MKGIWEKLIGNKKILYPTIAALVLLTAAIWIWGRHWSPFQTVSEKLITYFNDQVDERLKVSLQDYDQRIKDLEKRLAVTNQKIKKIDQEKKNVTIPTTPTDIRNRFNSHGYTPTR